MLLKYMQLPMLKAEVCVFEGFFQRMVHDLSNSSD